MMMTVLRTLAPHGSHPDLTVLPPETRAVLQRLADMPEVIVSTSRRIRKRKKLFLVLKDCAYANTAVKWIQFLPPSNSLWSICGSYSI